MTDQSAEVEGVVRSLVERPHQVLIAMDFDGTLAPIVPDPEQAFADQRALAALAALGRKVGTIAVITGRPTRTVVRLGELESQPGLGSLIVLGQYGVERWDAATGEFRDPPIPAEVAAAKQGVQQLAEREGVHFEDKGRAMAVHFRNASEPQGTMDRLVAPIEALAAEFGLLVEPGRLVIELRAAGMDKGRALRELVAERQATAVLFAGDDLGDIAAFEAIDALRAEGTTGLKVAVASPEQQRLAEQADIVVDGTGELAQWLSELAESMD